MRKPSSKSRPGAARSQCRGGKAGPIGRVLLGFLTMVFCLLAADVGIAHHVLGRPTYSLNEDSNTPPSMQAEVRIGDYFVTYLAFPAFPRPDVPGRINLYISREDDGAPFQGQVTFKARDESWLSWLGVEGREERLGVQPPDDNVFRQGYLFHAAGDYVVSAEFEAAGEPYLIEFPLRIGEPPPIGPAGIAVILVLAGLVAITVVQRRRTMTGKIRGAREQRG